MFSLLQFLQLEPFGELAWWNEMIKKPYEERDKNSIRLLQSILRPLFLRRTKTQTIDGEKIVNLPPRIVDTQFLEFDEEEMSFYTALYNQSRIKFQMLQKAHSINHNFANVLSLLLRLRQTCDHPVLVLSSVVEVFSLFLSLSLFLFTPSSIPRSSSSLSSPPKQQTNK